MDSINYEIKPIFKLDERVCKDFARIELRCDANRGHNHGDLYRGDCQEYYIQSDNEKYRFMFAAFYDKEIIGFTHGYLNGINMYLDNFYIDPMYHGFGIGTKLLKTTEDAVSIIRPNLELFPLTSAISFYQQYKYRFTPGGKFMTKKLPKTITGVVPVFEWCDELQAKLNVKVDSDLLKQAKYQPVFIYVNDEDKIDAVAIRMQNGKEKIKINTKKKDLSDFYNQKLSDALSRSL